MTGLCPLTWLAPARICLCVWVWGTGRHICSLTRKQLHNNHKEPRDYLVYSLRFTDEPTEAMKPSGSCQFTGPASEPGPEPRVLLPLTATSSSGFQNHLWVDSFTKRNHRTHWKLLYSFQFISGKEYRSQLARRRDTEGSVWEGFKCKASIVLSMYDRPCIDIWQYAQCVANQGSSPKLPCLEVLLGLHSISMSDLLLMGPNFIPSSTPLTGGQADISPGLSRPRVTLITQTIWAKGPWWVIKTLASLGKFQGFKGYLPETRDKGQISLDKAKFFTTPYLPSAYALSRQLQWNKDSCTTCVLGARYCTYFV